ncbi:MAG: sigma-70 family RNA polymerase sigma factor [Clostridium sp.]|jgi:RNA polymerase sigma-70 factor (ECF subfamily)|nr:sigma-70 family RNA polymerase sigma factor [Clostridium sp.]
MDTGEYFLKPVEEIFRQYGDMLYRTAYAQTMSTDDAQDAVSEVFLKYLTAQPKLNSAEHEKAWLIRTLINHCHDMARRKKVRSYTPLEDISDLAAKPHSDESRELLEAVMHLPEKEKTAILLHYFEEMSVEEISKALSISKSAVKMRLKRGREELKKTIS